jgi:hypothetical protein
MLGVLLLVVLRVNNQQIRVTTERRESLPVGSLQLKVPAEHDSAVTDV